MNLVEPYDPDTYAEAFFPVAEQLEGQAAEDERNQDVASASNLYLYGKSTHYVAQGCPNHVIDELLLFTVLPASQSVAPPKHLKLGAEARLRI
jgi:hypothetical protein